MDLASRVRATLREAGYHALADIIDGSDRLVFIRELTPDEREAVENAVIVAG